jgi:hypothetical protein
MSGLVDMLREAFNAGMSCAAAYEHGTYTVDFKKWHEENKSEIERLGLSVVIKFPNTKDFVTRKFKEGTVYKSFDQSRYMESFKAFIESPVGKVHTFCTNWIEGLERLYPMDGGTQKQMINELKSLKELIEKS